MRIRRSERAVFRELADGTGVLLHLDSTAYHGVNRIGVLIWSLIDEGTTLTRLTEDVRSRVMDPPPEIAEDVEEFVLDLSSRELIVVEDASAPGD
ncbi:MAG TPA: PqqD family protein [Actinomycetota bacterium]|nr:PqqD family protein [Actinomycetota bacterium]